MEAFELKILDPRALKILYSMQELGLITIQVSEDDGPDGSSKDSPSSYPRSAMSDAEFELYAERLLAPFRR